MFGKKNRAVLYGDAENTLALEESGDSVFPFDHDSDFVPFHPGLQSVANFKNGKIVLADHVPLYICIDIPKPFQPIENNEPVSELTSITYNICNVVNNDGAFAPRDDREYTRKKLLKKPIK